MVTGYTETTFKEFLHTTLSHTATGLGWSVAGGSYDEVLNDALLLLDLSDITTATSNTNLRQLRVAGKVSLWGAVASALAGDYNFSADGGQYSRSDAHEHAMKMLTQAQSEADVLGLAGYAVTSIAATYGRYDPYQAYTDSLATGIDDI